MSDRYRRAAFLKGAHRLDQLPPDSGKEVAFAGRSNSGKSSVLNALTQNRKLARTSKTPGRTREINFFTLDGGNRLVDLPGYGYARADAALRDHWAETLANYLHTRESLRGIVIVMDARHPFGPADEVMLELAAAAGLASHVLLNKCDKLSGSEGRAVLTQAKKRLDAEEAMAQLFSASKGTGIAELRGRLESWFR